MHIVKGLNKSVGQIKNYSLTLREGWFFEDFGLSVEGSVTNFTEELSTVSESIEDLKCNVYAGLSSSNCRLVVIDGREKFRLKGIVWANYCGWSEDGGFWMRVIRKLGV